MIPGIQNFNRKHQGGNAYISRNAIEKWKIQGFPLATEPGISLKILIPNEDIATKFEKEYVRCVRNEEECVCSPLQISLQYPH